eukprot:4473877-Prymnesium_polylepis.1
MTWRARSKESAVLMQQLHVRRRSRRGKLSSRQPERRSKPKIASRASETQATTVSDRANVAGEA